MPGSRSRSGRYTAQSLYPGYEHFTFDMWVERMEAEHLFSYRWHPYSVDPNYDYAKDATTLVEFHLLAKPEGTLLAVVESGFDKPPEGRRLQAFRMNEDGWQEQCQNLASYFASYLAR